MNNEQRPNGRAERGSRLQELLRHFTLGVVDLAEIEQIHAKAMRSTPIEGRVCETNFQLPTAPAADGEAPSFITALRDNKNIYTITDLQPISANSTQAN